MSPIARLVMALALSVTLLYAAGFRKTAVVLAVVGSLLLVPHGPNAVLDFAKAVTA
jgi:hypothetical protein